MSCGSCLFVVVLSVLSLSLSRHSPWRRFLPRLTWTHLSPRPPSSSSFRLHLSLHCGGRNSTHGLAQHRLGFCTSCCHFDDCFRFLVVFAMVCSVASYIQYLIPWLFVPNTFCTHNLSKCGLFQGLSQYGLYQNPGLHTCFGLNLDGGLKQNQCFCVQTLFYIKSCLYPQTACFTQKPCSCWACARAVCSLQDSSFHGGRRNTPKAVKYVYVCAHKHI